MSGVLLLLDVGVTLLWQEPVSAFLAAREQDTLERELGAESQRFGRSVTAASDEGPRARRTLARAARAFAARLRTGDAFGRVAMPTLEQVVRRRRGNGHGDAADRPRPLHGNRVARHAPDGGSGRPPHDVSGPVRRDRRARARRSDRADDAVRTLHLPRRISRVVDRARSGSPSAEATASCSRRAIRPSAPPRGSWCSPGSRAPASTG